MTKKAQLLAWIRARGVVRTHEVIEWGLANYSNRADRDARALAKSGYLRRLSEFEKETRYGKIHEDVWVATAVESVMERQMTLADYL